MSKIECSSRRVILTGATGFVGANLAHRLANDGHQVHLLVRHNFNPWRIKAIRPEVCLHEADLADEAGLAAVVRRIRPDWIFHLAVHGAYSSQVDVQQMVQTNIIGTINLLQACLKVGFSAFVNTGSSSEYGFKDHAPDERAWLEPNSYYAVTKASATLFCRYVAQSQGVLLPTLRLYSAYGSYEEPTRLMPTLIVRGLRGELPPLVNPDITRDYVYVDDVVDAYLLAATRPAQEPGAVYNVGTGMQTSMQQVVEIARQTLDIPAEPQWDSMPARAWDTHTWVADNRKITQELGWQPSFTVEQGFRQMARWLNDHPDLLALYETFHPRGTESLGSR